jgi:hypothetical protein
LQCLRMDGSAKGQGTRAHRRPDIPFRIVRLAPI